MQTIRIRPVGINKSNKAKDRNKCAIFAALKT